MHVSLQQPVVVGPQPRSGPLPAPPANKESLRRSRTPAPLLDDSESSYEEGDSGRNQHYSGMTTAQRGRAANKVKA